MKWPTINKISFVIHNFCYIMYYHCLLQEILHKSQSLVLVEEELEFPLENGYTLFEEVHDSTTMEPTYEESFTFFREMHVPTLMDPSHDEKFPLSNPLVELVLSPTFYTSTFCRIHPNEVWVKGLFFRVPHEEYGIHISSFDDDMTRVPSYLHF